MQCKFNVNGSCEISTMLAGIKVEAKQDACKACLSQENPMTINHVTSSKAVYALYVANKKIPQHIFTNINHSIHKETGPGTELEKLISWFKKKNGSCKCLSRIQTMNNWGADECEKRMPTIMRWLRHSAAKQKIPFVEAIAHRLVKRAIDNARKQVGSRSNDST